MKKLLFFLIAMIFAAVACKHEPKKATVSGYMIVLTPGLESAPHSPATITYELPDKVDSSSPDIHIVELSFGSEVIPLDYHTGMHNLAVSPPTPGSSIDEAYTILKYVDGTNYRNCVILERTDGNNGYFFFNYAGM